MKNFDFDFDFTLETVGDSFLIMNLKYFPRPWEELEKKINQTRQKVTIQKLLPICVRFSL